MDNTFVGLKKCGCLAMAVVDSPEHKQETAREVSKAIRDGLDVQRLSTQTVREMPWKCAQHQTAKGDANQTEMGV